MTTGACLASIGRICRGSSRAVVIRTLPRMGRGLAIVEGLADEWGVAIVRGGKRIWARVYRRQ